MLIDVALRSFCGVVGRVVHVPCGQMRMVGGRLVVACFVMLRGLPVVMGGPLVVLGCRAMVGGCLL
ncbi:MAG TPA: hypothetical protein VMT45_13270 [Thermoanaerobaculaceae bacterium]|nr:hypothetical protein [Thermoanaerobaculaceae bacterium]